RKNFGPFSPPASKKGRGSGGRNFLLAGGFFLKILRIFRKVGSEFFPEAVLFRTNAVGRLAPAGLGVKNPAKASQSFCPAEGGTAKRFCPKAITIKITNKHE
ncbi:hypothetical protein ACFL1O_00230, partial [Patescibacteria group bacterium]